MTVKITRPSIDIRGTLDELNKPSGIAGNAMLRADSVQEQRNLLQVGRKNLIINGAMQVAQRGTTATTIDSNDYSTCDRFLQEFPAASWSVTSTQETDGPAPFTHSLKLEATSGASLGASEYMIPFEYRVEGYDFSRFGYNTAEAKEVTISFWIKSNRTGTNTVDFTIQGAGTNPFIARQYTINTADTWEYKTVVMPANTSCTNLQTGGTNGMTIFWWNASGSDFNSGAIASSWGTQVAANRAVGTTSTVSTGDYWQITGVQLEVGSVATDFEHRSYGEELALCQRYYQMYSGFSYQVIGGFTGTMETTTNCNFFGNIPEMRGAPTLQENNLHVSTASGSVFGVASTSLPSTSKNGFRLAATINTSVAANTFMFLRSPGSSAYIAFDAEL